MSDTICILPFIHLYTQPDGEVKPCCISSGFDNSQFLSKNAWNKPVYTIEEVWNSDEYKKLRKNMIDGVRNKVCDVCYNKEDMGEVSPRQTYNDNTLWEMPVVNDDYSVPTSFQHIDIRFSNLCNFQCRMCNHTFSNRWYDTQHLVADFVKEKYRKVLKASDTIIDDLIPYISDIRSVYFAGGEPLIMPEHFALLNWLSDEFNHKLIHGKIPISIHYSTNLSTLKYNETDLIKYWNKFSRVQLAISCDGIGKVGEYQRVGFSHSNFIKNLNKIKNIASNKSVFSDKSTDDGNIYYSFQYTTTIFNIHHIFEFIDYMITNDYIESEDIIDFYYAWNPNYVTINNLTQYQKDEYNKLFDSGIPKLKSDKTISQLLNIQNFMNSSRSADAEYVKESVEKLDDLHKTSYSELNLIL